LVLVGGRGHCMKLGDQVAHAAPVAVMFDTWSLARGLPARARIVCATSDPAAQYNGWSLS
jgi:hypothetical protein